MSKRWRTLAVLVLAAGCSGDATAPDPPPVEAQSPANRAPVLSGEIPGQRLPGPGEAVSVSVSSYFADADGDPLTFAAFSSDTVVVRAAAVGDTVRLEAVAPGEAEVTITATDPDGLEATAVFRVIVTPPDPRFILEVLYEATGGPEWERDDNWLTDAPLGEWYGVSVQRASSGWTEVSELDLSRNNLEGSIPPELGDLTALEVLDFGGNDLSGPIPPELGNLASLERLRLYHSNLSGSIPPELGNLGALKTLNLYNNNLEGPIPPELGELAALEMLDLENNLLGIHHQSGDFSASIPLELGNLASLERLYLDGNGLSGPIPPELGNLTALERLELRNNSLSGPIPPELGNLASLERLRLGGNNLSGPIPPELGNLTALEQLELRGKYPNHLSGPIPPEFGNLTALERLELPHNRLSGPIPPELGNLTALMVVNLRENDLSGPIPPELGNLTALQGLNLGGNALSGPIPPELGNLPSLRSLNLFPSRGLLCVPDVDPDFIVWLIGAHPADASVRLVPCHPGQPADVRLLPTSLMRADGNGLSLTLPYDLTFDWGGVAEVNVSDPGVVAATVVGKPLAGGQLKLVPRSIGRADVELVPSRGGLPYVAGVVVREPVGTFGIDIVVNQPAPLGYEEVLVAAADWWSSLLDGTEWEDRPAWSWEVPGCNLDVATALPDEMMIVAGTDSTFRWPGYARPCLVRTSEGPVPYKPAAGGSVWVAPHWAGTQSVLRHEIGHLLGLVLWPQWTGLTTEDRAHFTGSHAVEAYRTGGGDPGLPGVPLNTGEQCRCHWDDDFDLMGRWIHGYPTTDGLSLAALADAGYTVDMSRARPWFAAPSASVPARESFRDIVIVEILEPPGPLR